MNTDYQRLQPNAGGRGAREQAIRRQSRRGGFALLAVIVVSVICLALIGVWAQSAVRQRLQIESRYLRLQATRLAEAGLRRAARQRTGNPDYAGEDWSIPAEALGKTQAATVRIQLTPSANGRAVLVESTAQFPSGVARRAQSTKRMEIQLQTPGDQP